VRGANAERSLSRRGRARCVRPPRPPLDQQQTRLLPDRCVFEEIKTIVSASIPQTLLGFLRGLRQLERFTRESMHHLAVIAVVPGRSGWRELAEAVVGWSVGCGAAGVVEGEGVTGEFIVSKPTSNQQFHTRNPFEAQQPAHSHPGTSAPPLPASATTRLNGACSRE
jgi:hypothetical protein